LTGCVEFEGYIHPGNGHAGNVRRDGVRKHAYVWAFLDAGGVLTEEKPWVLHTCDNGGCVNVEHLYAGDARDNVRDMFARGRHRHQNPTCQRGHLWTAENTYTRPNGRRTCRVCVSIKQTEKAS